MRSLAALTLLAILLGTSAAWAQTSVDSQSTPPDITRSRFFLTAGGHVMLSSGYVCRQTSPDTVDCVQGTGWAGLHLAPRWRISNALSIGGIGSIGWRPSSQGTGGSNGPRTEFGQRLWRVSAEARLHPFRAGGLVPWVGLEAGVASVRDSITYRGEPPRAQEAVSQFGPVGGLGIGSDYFVVPWFSVGFELQGLVLAMGKAPPNLGSSGEKASAYGTQTGGALGVNLTIHP